MNLLYGWADNIAATDARTFWACVTAIAVVVSVLTVSVWLFVRQLPHRPFKTDEDIDRERGLMS